MTFVPLLYPNPVSSFTSSSYLTSKLLTVTATDVSTFSYTLTLEDLSPLSSFGFTISLFSEPVDQSLLELLNSWSLNQRLLPRTIKPEVVMTLDGRLSQFFTMRLDQDCELTVFLLPGMSIQLRVDYVSGTLTFPSGLWLGEVPPPVTGDRLYSFTCHLSGEVIGSWGDLV